MSCRNCKINVSPNASVCPHCGEPNPYDHRDSSGIAAIIFLIFSLPLLSKKPKDNKEAYFKVFILIVFSIFLIAFAYEVLKKPSSVISYVLLIFFLIYLLYCWHLNTNFIINNLDKKLLDRSFIQFFSPKFIKFIYSKEYFILLKKSFRCVSLTKANRINKMKKEFKLKTSDEAEILETKLSIGVFSHIIIFFTFLILLTNFF